MASSNQHEHLTLHKGWQGSTGGGEGKEPEQCSFPYVRYDGADTN